MERMVRMSRGLAIVLAFAMVAVAEPAHADSLDDTTAEAERAIADADGDRGRGRTPADAADPRTSKETEAPSARAEPAPARPSLSSLGFGDAWFEPNRGQFDPSFDLVGRAAGATVALSRDGATVNVAGRAPVTFRPVRGARVVPSPEGRRGGLVNYFLGNESSGWIAGVPRFRAARYAEVWPGVDVVYRPARSAIAYDVELDAGVDPDVVALEVSGARALRVDDTGVLAIQTDAGVLKQSAPVAFQRVGGRRAPVAARFIVDGNVVRFSVGSFDRRLPLVIDPTFTHDYYTYLGGSSDDLGVDVDVFTDASGSTRVAILGDTSSANLPIRGAPYATTPSGSDDMFVAEFDLSLPPADQLRWLTYLGGPDERPSALAYDRDGRILVAGHARHGFPTTTDAFQPNGPATSLGAVVAVLDPRQTGLQQLRYGTFLAPSTGSSNVGPSDARIHGASGLFVDEQGRAHITGFVDNARAFPTTPDALIAASSICCQQGYYAIIDPELDGADSLAYSTILGGGNQTTQSFGVTVGADGLSYVVGGTTSASFPVTPDALQPVRSGSYDAFLTVLDPTAPREAQLVYGTYLGGDGEEMAKGVAVADDGRIMLAGRTGSADLPTPGGFQLYDTNPTTDGFFIVLDRRLQGTQQVVYGTYLGSNNSGPQLEIDGDLVYLASAGPLFAEFGSGTSHLIVLDPTKNGAASVVGNYGPRHGINALATDGAGAAYVAGTVHSTRDAAPTDDAFDRTANGRGDAFLARIVPEDEVAPIWPPGGAVTVTASGSDFVTVRWPYATDDLGMRSYRVSVGGQQLATVPAADHAYTLTGLDPLTAYDIAVVAADAAGNVAPALPVRATTEAPGLPGQATLGATSMDGGRMELAWDPADPVSTYRVYRRVGVGSEALIADVTAPRTTFRDTGLAASTAMSYRVSAVNDDGTERPHTSGTAATTPDLRVDTTRWDGTIRRGVLPLDGAIAITARAEASRDVSASVEVSSWYADGTPGEPMEDAPVTVTIDVAMRERQPSVYEASMPLSGVASVRSITVIARDGQGHDASRATTDRLPRDVAGALDMTIDVGLEGWQTASARLTLTSAETGDGDALRLLGDAPHVVATRAMAPGSYRASMMDRAWRDLGEADVVVRPGRRDQVTPSLGTVRPHLPFTMRVVGLNDVPLPDVRVVVSDEATGEEYASALTGSDGRISGTARGARLVIATDPQLHPYAVESRGVTLTAYDQTVPISLTAALPTATVVGTVRGSDGATRPGVRVTFSTTIGGRTFTQTTTSTADGTYEATVFQGTVSVEAYERWYGKTRTLTQQITGATTLDLNLDAPVVGTLHLALSTRYAADTEARPVDLDHRAAYHFHTRATSGRFSARALNTTQVLLERIDAPIEVCADGYESDLPRACTTVRLDAATRTATASLALEQTAVVLGTVRFADGSTPTRWSATTHRLVDGERTNARTEHGPGSDLDVSLFEAGPHDLVVTSSKVVDGQAVAHTGTVTVTASAGDVVDAGVVILWPAGHGFTIAPRQVSPGGRAQVVFEIPEIPAGGCARSGTISFRLPAGVSFVPGSVTENGTAVSDPTAWEWTTFGGGPIYAPKRTVGFWVRVAEDVDDTPRWLTRISSSSYSCPGTSNSSEPVRFEERNVLLVAGTSIAAPRYTKTPAVPVSGRAPANAEVRVLVDGALRATTTATEGGFWRTTVALPSSPLPRPFLLRAESHDGERVAVTDTVGVEHDATRPVMTKMTLEQADGRRIEVDPRNGVARFPYVFSPGKSFEVTLTFDEPARVKDARVWIGTSDTKAIRSADGSWTATLQPSFTQLGRVRATWDVKPAPVDLTPDKQRLTEDEVRAGTYGPFAAIENAVVEESSGPGVPAVVSMDLPELDAHVRTEIRTETIQYQPTEEDLRLAEESGTAMYDVKWDIEEEEGGIRLRASMVIPIETLQAAAASGGEGPLSTLARFAPAGSSPAASSIGDSIQFAIEGFMSSPLPGVLSNVFGVVFDIVAVLGMEAKIGDLRRMVRSQCPPEVAAGYLAELEELENQLLGRLVITFVLLGASLALAPASAGVGTAIAVWAALAAFGNFLNLVLAAGIQQVEDRITSDTRCVPGGGEPGDPSADEPEDDGGDDSCNDCVMDPIYIYDPSGYVYELFPDERITGATATLQHAPDPDGPWSTWDADWFGQQNPLTTDARGRYGWDVPEGWWRVRYEKAGYETTHSDVLRVLPPHFDVNVPMRSLAQPKIAHVSARTGATFIDVTFDRWMLASTLGDGAFQVSGDEPLPTTAALVDARTAPGGEQVARTVRLDLGHALAAGATYTVAIDRLVATYAGIPLGADTTRAVTVTAAPQVQAPDARSVQYGDAVAATVVSATDADSAKLNATTSYSLDGGAPVAGLPAGLSLSAPSCQRNGPGTSCSWSIGGTALVRAGTYAIQVEVADDVAPVARTITLTVAAEGVTIADARGLPLPVALAEGPSEARRVTFSIREDDAGAPIAAGRGDLSLASVTAYAADIAGVRTVVGRCAPSAAATDGSLNVTCAFAGLQSGAHSLHVLVDGGYYEGSATMPLVVQDAITDAPTVEPTADAGSLPQLVP